MAEKIASLYAEIYADTSKLEDGLDKTKTGLKDTDKQAGSVQDTFKKIAKTFTKVGIAAAAVGVAIKKAFDWSREGAAIAQTEASFASMLSTIGEGTDVLNEWRSAVNGTISDVDLMSGFQTVAAGTSKELTQAFFDNNAALLQISKAASALNPQLGDTAYMYESITRGIKRQSPLILDNLGLVVKVEESNKKYAEALGKTTDELTAEERQMALLNGVLDQGNTLISQLGGTVESATDPWDRFTTAIKNNTDRAKKNFAESENLTSALNASADAMENSYTWRERLTMAQEKGLITQQEWADLVIGVNTNVMTLAEGLEYLDKKTQDYNDNITESARLTEEWALANDQGYAATQNAADGVSDLNLAYMDVNLAMQEYNRQLLFSIASEGLTADQAFILAEKMGLVDETTVAAYGAIGDLKDELANDETFDEAADSVARLADGLDRLPADKHVRVIYTEVYNRVMGTGYSGGATEMTDTGGSGGTNNNPPKPGLPPLPGASNEALGGFYETSTPTLYRASETGQPETAIFVPQGKSIYDVATPQQVAKVMPEGGMGNVTNNYYFDAVEADRIPQTIEQLKVLAL